MKIRMNLAVAAGLLVQAGIAQTLQYTLQDVGTFEGGVSTAYRINNSGTVVGESYAGYRKFDAFLWTGPDSPMQDIAGPSFLSGANGINNAGQIVGIAQADGIARGYIWDNGSREELTGLSSGQSSSVVINDESVIVGQCMTPDGIGHACLWDQDRLVTDLSLSIGNPDTRFLASYAYAVNNNGTVVGYAESPQGSNPATAFRWKDGEWQFLATLGGARSYARFINDAEVIVGYSDVTGGQHAFRWDAENGMQDLGVLREGDNYSTAEGINNAGAIVGQSRNPAGQGRACLWLPSEGRPKIIDLNTLIPEGSGWTLTVAYSINGKGQIAGTGTFGGATRAFRLDPVQP